MTLDLIGVGLAIMIVAIVVPLGLVLVSRDLHGTKPPAKGSAETD